MKYSGTNFRQMPLVSGWSFLLDELSLSNTTGVATVGFSGVDGNFAFTFRSGEIYDPNGKLVYGYNPNEGFSISGDIDNFKYRYFINNELIRQSNKIPSQISQFNISTTGVELSSKLSIGITGESIEVLLASSYPANLPITGQIVNNSDAGLRVFSTDYSFLNNSPIAFDKSITGKTLASTPMNFSLPKIDGSSRGGVLDVKFRLDTSFGLIERTVQINRQESLTGKHYDMIFNGDSQGISHPFVGSGLPNQFIYNPGASGLSIQVLQYSAIDSKAESQSKTFSLQVAPNGASDNVIYTGKFLTGFSMQNSGFYSRPATAEFLDYGHVTGTAFAAGNLFSVQCGNTIPANFLALDGLGVSGSGSALLKPVRISLYGSRNFYTITGFSVATPGTGYNYNPSISLLKPAGCIDVPLESGSQYIYNPFSGAGLRKLDAGYFHGELMASSSVKHISGANATGISYTGLWIGNAGSGYDSGNIGYIPSLKIVRNPSDIYAGISLDSGFNASGTTSFNKQANTYSFTGNWAIQTGHLGANLTPISLPYYGGTTGYYGTVSLPASAGGIVIAAHLSPSSFSISPSIAITAVGTFGGSGGSFISGLTTYSTGTGYHRIFISSGVISLNITGVSGYHFQY